MRLFILLLMVVACGLCAYWVNREATKPIPPAAATDIPQLNTELPQATFTPEQGAAMDTPPTTYYAKNQAFLRECPKRTCATVVQVGAGVALVADGVIDGDEVSPGNAVWYRVQVGLLTAYVYSEVVTLDANSSAVIITMTTAPTSEPTLTPVQIIAVPVVATSIPTNTPTDIPIVPTATPLPAFTPETGLAVDMPAKTYYVKSQAIVRECPQRTCASVAELGAGAALVSDGVINGEIVNLGNAIWYRVNYNGQTAYVYSDVVSGVAPAATNSGGATSGGNISSAPSGSVGSCPNISATCTQLSSCEEAKACLAAGNTDLDGNGNGIPCETLCGG